MAWAVTVWRSRWRAGARGVGLGLLIVPMAIGMAFILFIWCGVSAIREEPACYAPVVS